MKLNIKAIRRRAGIKQCELARELHVGQSTISQWESGETAPHSYRIPDLARALGCGIEELYRKEGERT